MNLDLSAKNAFVCGSSQGIGKACALLLAKMGANVTLIARNETALSWVLEELNTDKGQQHDMLVIDFSNSEELKTKVSDYLSRTGKIIHILINNTGGPAPGPITGAEGDAFLNGLNNHLICNQYLAQAVFEGMKAAQYGRIVNIISTSVKVPINGLGVSNTVRGAVASWAKTWANEVGQYGITVNNLLPGFTDTARLRNLVKNKATKAAVSEEEMANRMMGTVPMNRFGAAEEIANAVGFLVSPAASYVNGINLPVDGGRTGCL